MSTTDDGSAQMRTQDKGLQVASWLLGVMSSRFLKVGLGLRVEFNEVLLRQRKSPVNGA